MEEFSLSPALMEDSKKIWEWRNEDAARRNSFNSSPIPWKEHQKWFAKKLADRNVIIYMITRRKEKIGYVRFDRHSRQVSEVSICLDKTAQGKGYGPKALQLACEDLFSHTSTEKILAHIKIGNKASINAFSTAEFVKKQMVKLKENHALEMELTKKK